MRQDILQNPTPNQFEQNIAVYSQKNSNCERFSWGQFFFEQNVAVYSQKVRTVKGLAGVIFFFWTERCSLQSKKFELWKV